jgi:hypothetical protein
MMDMISSAVISINLSLMDVKKAFKCQQLLKNQNYHFILEKRLRSHLKDSGSPEALSA